MKELMFLFFLAEENGHNACNTSTYDPVNPRRTICTFCLAEIKKKPTYHNTSSQWNTYNTENTYYNFYSPSPPPTSVSKYWFWLVLIIKIMIFIWEANLSALNNWLCVHCCDGCEYRSGLKYLTYYYLHCKANRKFDNVNETLLGALA